MKLEMTTAKEQLAIFLCEMGLDNYFNTEILIDTETPSFFVKGSLQLGTMKNKSDFAKALTDLKSKVLNSPILQDHLAKQQKLILAHEVTIRDLEKYKQWYELTHKLMKGGVFVSVKDQKEAQGHL